MKTSEMPHGLSVQNQKTDKERKEGRERANKQRENKKEMSNEEMKAYLLRKFGR